MTDNAPVDLEEMITPAHIDSLMACIDSIHRILDAFFEMDTDTIRNLPNLYCVRNAYAAVALIKIDGVFRSRGSKFEALFSPDLKIEQYLNTMIDVLAKAAEGQKAIIAFGFGFVFRRLKQWYNSRSYSNLDSCPGMQPSSQERSAGFLLNEQERFETPAVSGPGTASEGPVLAELRTPESMSVSMPFNIPGANVIDHSTMYNLGLTQFYDFGFTFDDMGLTDTTQTDAGWYPFTMP